MTQMEHLWGLPTIQPTEQAIGAALSVGVKPVGGGYPIEKDRFHVVTAKTRERKERGGRKVEYRPHDPRFSAFNEADLETRRVFYGMLCYHREEECWHPNYGMYRFPSGDLTSPKTKRFACMGNGKTAERWVDGAAAAIPCPGEGCPYRQDRGEDKAPCQPRARFWFIPRWLPSQGNAFARYLPDTSIKMLLGRPIMRLSTQGRAARDTFAGMIQTVRAQAEPLGGIPSLYGLPFEMTLSEGTNAEKKTRWPDITFTLDGDWFEWLRWVTTEFRQLKEAPPMVSLGSASAAELDAETVGAEHAAIVPYSAPAGPVVKPAVEAVAEVGEVTSSPASKPASEAAVESRAGRIATGESESKPRTAHPDSAGEAQPADRPRPGLPAGDKDPPPAAAGIGDDGVAELEAFVKEQRKRSVHGTFPPTFGAVVSEWSEAPPDVPPKEWSKDEQKAFATWAWKRAEQMPREKS